MAKYSPALPIWRGGRKDCVFPQKLGAGSLGIGRRGLVENDELAARLGASYGFIRSELTKKSRNALAPRE